MSIEEADVAAAIIKALPERAAIVSAHLAEWQDEPMPYLLLSDIFQMMSKIPRGPEQLDLIRRAYDLCDKALSDGSREVRDCFAIELIEPLSFEPDETFLSALGPFGRLMHDEMLEWSRLYTLMKRAVDNENERLGLKVFDGTGIDAKNRSARVVVRMETWMVLNPQQHDMSFARLRDAWHEASGQPAGITITGPRESSFTVLRG
jgi:hypothetical protein